MRTLLRLNSAQFSFSFSLLFFSSFRFAEAHTHKSRFFFPSATSATSSSQCRSPQHCEATNERSHHHHHRRPRHSAASSVRQRTTTRQAPARKSCEACREEQSRERGIVFAFAASVSSSSSAFRIIAAATAQLHLLVAARRLYKSG